MHTVAMNPPRAPGRRTFALLALVAGLPFAIGWLLFLNPHWLPQGAAQKGTLLESPPALADFALRGLDGAPLATARGGDDWLLLHVSGGPCGGACQERSIEMRQVRRALGVEMPRLRRILALPAAPLPTVESGLRRASPDLTLATGGGSMRPGIYLVDPRDEAILFYDETAPAKAPLKDVKRLLKVSRSW